MRRIQIQAQILSTPSALDRASTNVLIKQRENYNKFMGAPDRIQGNKSGTGWMPLPPTALFSGLLLLTVVEDTLMTGKFWGDSEHSFQIIGTTYALISAVSVFITAVLSKRERKTWSSKIYNRFTAFLVVACVLIAARTLTNALFPLIVSVIATVLTAVAYGPLILSWIALYSRLPMHTIFECFAIAYGFGPIVSEALVVMEPKWLIGIFMSLVSLGSAKLFGAASKSVESFPTIDLCNAKASNSEPFPLRPVIICGVVTFVTTFMQNCGPIANVPLTNFIGASIAIVIFGITTIQRRLYFIKLQHIALVLAVASILCLPFLNETIGIAGMALSLTANLVFLVFAETLLCGVALRYAYDAVWLVGVSLGVMAVSSFLAVCCSAIFSSLNLSMESTTLFAEILSLIVLIMFLRFITESDVLGAWGMEEQANNTPYANTYVPLRVFELSYRYGLTKREEEVCVLLAQGNKVADIEKILVISKSTVKSHVAHIYKKMGIHSIDEFRSIFVGSKANNKR